MIQLATILTLVLFTQITAATDRECEKVTDVLGFAVVSFDSTTVLPFFAESVSSKLPVQVLRFYNDPATDSLSFQVTGKESYPLLRPEAHKLDYFLFELPVKRKRNAWLEVVVDERTGKTLWVREGKAVRFVDWLPEMQKAFAVERKSSEDNPLRIKPYRNAREVKLKGRDCFKIAGMRGDWIRVVQQDHCAGVASSSAKGWVRWRNDRGCLLVNVYPFA